MRHTLPVDSLDKRFEYEFEHELGIVLGPEGCVPLSKTAINSDIRSYVEQRLDKDAGFQKWTTNPGIVKLVCDQITSKADGMFRWAACQLDSLENCLDREGIETELDSLPRDLNETYERILNNISLTLKSKANRLLQFLLYSKTPLTLEKAVDIVAVRRESFDIADRMPRPEEIQRICSSLVTSVVNGKGRHRTIQLQLAHSSVQEFLLGHADIWMPEAAIGGRLHLKRPAEMVIKPSQTFFWTRGQIGGPGTIKRIIDFKRKSLRLWSNALCNHYVNKTVQKFLSYLNTVSRSHLGWRVNCMLVRS
ncbi:hypothetical protein CGMCC3_g16940 [Colletotrichum fructicola]|nr:uncharacterized protein CGMCC3_g16940 [Colletotrichum fructicola]KAE9566933.1 hypothetical protein CGMCC3_g16940 [Colletotrichum fructicola]